MDGSNSFKKLFDSFFSDNDVFEQHLTPGLKAKSFFAHLPKSEGVQPELLTEHIIRVNRQVLRILESSSIEEVIDDLIIEIISLRSFSNPNAAFHLCKLFFFGIFEFHDYGKLNPNFQIEKMSNYEFERTDSPFGSTHSELSGFYYSQWCIHQIKNHDLNESEIEFLLLIMLGLKSGIRLHHSSTFSAGVEFRPTATEKLNEFFNTFHFFNWDQEIDQINELWLEGSGTNNNTFLKAVILEEFNAEDFASQFYRLLYFLTRINFSLLTTADQMATYGYMQQLDQERIPLPLRTIEDQQEHCRNFKEHPCHKYNKEIIDQTDELADRDISSLRDRNRENINKLRSTIGAKVLKQFRAHSDERLFFLEAPTGAGKTNLSMLLIHHLLEHDPSVERIFYVFPFTTLADQTINEFKDRFKLREDQVTALHSRAFRTNSSTEEDAHYGKDKTFYLHDLYGNGPMTFTSHVQFWNMLKSSRKKDIHRFCQLTNSVVIFDELQAYPPDHWDKINYFLKHTSRLLNMRCILMSATLPDFEQLNVYGADDNSYVRLLSEEDRNAVFTNPNFGNRVDIISKEEIEFNESIERLATFITETAKNENLPKPCKVIVECIKKQTASDLYQELKKKPFWDTIDLLSGTILEPQRRKIIRRIKNDQDKSEPDDRIDGNYILITTQVVEAGVDIDMDLGFKDSSLLDSDEQLAGRINRNASKGEAKLYIFNFDDASHIYRDDKRLKIPREIPNISKLFRQEKNFQKYYMQVTEELNTRSQIGTPNALKSYCSNFDKLNYNAVDNQFKIIDSDTIPVFIPVSFELSDLDYDAQICEHIEQLKEDYHLNLTDNKHLSGEKVWSAFRSFSTADADFLEKHEPVKRLLPLVNLFTISIYNDAEVINNLREFSDHEKDTADATSYGYIYLSRYDDGVYDVKQGLTLDDEIMHRNVFL